MASKWDELERWMEGQQLPKGFEVLREPDWVEHFVRKMMTKALPEAAGRMTGSKAASVTESKSGQYFLVKYKLPAGCERERISLTVREDLLRIEGLPGGRRQVVKLPGLVKPRVCQAAVKAGVLHIKLRRRPASGREYGHYIKWY